MTSIWGPLGWMTLHSTAFAYSDNPTSSERDLMVAWLDMFRDTITCPSCKGHFTTLLETYRNQFPGMLSNRHEFIMFTFRAHNSVNKRLNKPIYGSVDECVATLRNATQNRTAKEYRNAYLAHISHHWKMFQDVSGIIAIKKIQEMRRIENDYISLRDPTFSISVRPDVTVLPMERTTESRPVFIGATAKATAGFRITTGGLRLRR